VSSGGSTQRKGGVAAASMWHRPRSPFNIKSATVGEEQTPITLSCVEDDGLGKELRVLLAHSMRNGHHQLPRPAGMTRLDPVR
jgi:hypothetical protein